MDDSRQTQAKRLNSLLAENEIQNKVVVYRHWPEVIQMELTSRCNGQCVMCRHYYEWNDCGKDIDESAMDKLEALLPWCRLVLINGYGEPMLSGQFLRCMELLKTYHAKAMMTTNLSVLPEEAFEYLSVFESINVSCNGAEKEDYERIHRGLHFEKFDSNLGKLMHMCGDVVSLSCVAMAETVTRMDDLLLFAYRHGVRSVRFGRLGVNRMIRNDEQDLLRYPQAAAYYFSKAEKLAAQLGIALAYPGYYPGAVDCRQCEREIDELAGLRFRYDADHQREIWEEFLQYHSKNVYENREPAPKNDGPVSCKGICDWVAKGLYIDVNGRYFPCCESKCVCYGDDWNSDAAQSLRGEFYAGKLPSFCRNCPFIINNELQLLRCERIADENRIDL